MRLTSKDIGSWGIFAIEGTVDSVQTKVFTDALSDYISKGHSNIIMDLSKAPFLSIGAIRYLNQLCQIIEAKSGRLVLLGANERIRRHIDIFVSWSKLKEINSLWEVIPLQMAGKLLETSTQILTEPTSSAE